MTTAPHAPSPGPAIERTRTPRRRRTAIAVGIAAVGATGLGLGALFGMQPAMDLLSEQHREHFDTYAQAETGWVGVPMPEWIPRDATDIHALATNRETNAVIRIASDADEPLDCEVGDRFALPALTADWMPAPVEIDDEFRRVPGAADDAWPSTVWKCDRYEVAPVEGGFIGWFEAREVGQTPVN